eukprot:2992580-Pleurochrysis_carterae.AAC.1
MLIGSSPPSLQTEVDADILSGLMQEPPARRVVNTVLCSACAATREDDATIVGSYLHTLYGAGTRTASAGAECSTSEVQ